MKLLGHRLASQLGPARSAVANLIGTEVLGAALVDGQVCIYASDYYTVQAAHTHPG